ncbi:Protein of unknown function [Paracoccus thiocyanatus]|uniref:DUF2934 domain-containing protein n=1 Tax=Paracoccus thiocyanatus TaxID=34006 RepID=A0A1N6VZY5_9RHOB|nr:DUF2934 domain-containing protein [Paracoccus thiocyanatus]SIQ83384.1 Protein of unknown function [Paracoccus thiocyanatus]
MEEQDKIRERAHQIWESEGRPSGREVEHWQQAERELRDGAATAGVTDHEDAAGMQAPPGQPAGETRPEPEVAQAAAALATGQGAGAGDTDAAGRTAAQPARIRKSTE